MRAVVQRVSSASVTVDGRILSQIERGFLVLVGFSDTDTDENLQWTARKIVGLRVFEDLEGKMNLGLAEIGGEILAVSQFTLYADVQKGRRPAFVEAASPELAEKLFDRFCSLLESEGFSVRRGVFRAKMSIGLINEGPVTIIVEQRRRLSP
jgi:D-tyrosyl-tRNA(Tyr) deacylase